MEIVDTILRYDGHSERTSFAVTSLGKQDIILGFTWLQEHNPEINWQTRKDTVSAMHTDGIGTDVQLHELPESHIMTRTLNIRKIVMQKIAKSTIQTFSGHKTEDAVIYLNKLYGSVANTIGMENIPKAFRVLERDCILVAMKLLAEAICDDEDEIYDTEETYEALVTPQTLAYTIMGIHFGLDYEVARAQKVTK
ncbi:hypothetical protein JB92DRAFT_3135111 [Gautieria morchelliformis]|nr:hypothetical protein JB92DRAFT_3135111 [Gautieria morchelliformis]